MIVSICVYAHSQEISEDTKFSPSYIFDEEANKELFIEVNFNDIWIDHSSRSKRIRHYDTWDGEGFGSTMFFSGIMNMRPTDEEGILQVTMQIINEEEYEIEDLDECMESDECVEEHAEAFRTFKCNFDEYGYMFLEDCRIDQLFTGQEAIFTDIEGFYDHIFGNYGDLYNKVLPLSIFVPIVEFPEYEIQANDTWESTIALIDSTEISSYFGDLDGMVTITNTLSEVIYDDDEVKLVIQNNAKLGKFVDFPRKENDLNLSISISEGKLSCSSVYNVNLNTIDSMNCILTYNYNITNIEQFRKFLDSFDDLSIYWDWSGQITIELAIE